MGINFLGLIAAVTAFLTIWIGHVTVRKIESITVNLWKPIVIAVLLGLALGYAALATYNRPIATVLGILSVTLLWDAFEIRRQANRIREGHAPANPNNPRHAAILVEPNSLGTTFDILKRDPVGMMVDKSEAIRLIGKR